MQLAHYRRMLEAVGLASSANVGGILGKEEVVVWCDLDEPTWTTPARSGRKKRTSMGRYDFEFDFRLDIAAVAMLRLDGGDVDLLVKPMPCGECDPCGFRAVCFESLTQGSGDASLLPGLSYSQWRTLRDAGVTECDQVASLHYPTAELVARGVDIGGFLRLAGEAATRERLEYLRPRAGKQLDILEQAGLTTVDDLLEMTDPITADIGAFVAPLILHARAAIGSEAVYRRPGSSAQSVPRADVEIDIDMENVNEGVYLWGTYLSDRSGSSGLEVGYRPFAYWAGIDNQSELGVLTKLLEWLDDVRRTCMKQGLSLRAYVWHESAENTQLRGIATYGREELLHSVESLIASDEWVDLKAVFEQSWITGTSTSLKTIAPLADHKWPVDNPGGALSMLKYEAARGEDDQVASESRHWLLEYNRGDVLATKTIREWLDAHGHDWPEVSTE